jgi:hypothetical protein
MSIHKCYCIPMSIIGQKEIAHRLDVKENTVNQWMVRGMLPPPDGSVSGNPAWHSESIDKWAWSTGRFPALRVRILNLLTESPSGGGFATPITHVLIEKGVVGPETSPAKVASILTDLFNEGYVSIHLRNEWKITDQGRDFLAKRMCVPERRSITYEPTPEEIVRIFTQWELAAARSPNAMVAATAPLKPPSLVEARTLVPRLRQIQLDVANSDRDWHGRPIGNRDQAAMGQLWEEWRDDKLGVLNGYREVWQPPDPFYDERRA